MKTETVQREPESETETTKVENEFLKVVDNDLGIEEGSSQSCAKQKRDQTFKSVFY